MQQHLPYLALPANDSSTHMISSHSSHLHDAVSALTVAGKGQPVRGGAPRTSHAASGRAFSQLQPPPSLPQGLLSNEGGGVRKYICMKSWSRVSCRNKHQTFCYRPASVLIGCLLTCQRVECACISKSGEKY